MAPFAMPSIGFAETPFRVTQAMAGHEVFYAGEHAQAEVDFEPLAIDSWVMVTNERPSWLILRPGVGNEFENGFESVVLNGGDSVTVQAIEVESA